MVRTGSTFLQNEVFNKIKNKKILSSECISGNFVSTKDQDITAYANIDYLLEKFDTKILIVFRDYNTWIKSCFNKYISVFGYKNYDNWKKLIGINEKWMIEYRNYLKNFENIKIMNYEDLLTDNYSFVKEICDLLDINMIQYNNKYHNKTRNKARLNLKLLINKFSGLI